MEEAILNRKSVIKSRVDSTVKHTYTSLRTSETSVLMEVAYIDKQDGKVILCVPTQSNCAMACTFCHTTGMAGKVAVSDLSPREMTLAVKLTYEEETPNLLDRRTILVSFMGCGEPLNNWRNVVIAMSTLRTWAEAIGVPIRFAIATMLPATKAEEFAEFTNYVRKLHLPVKVHLSLHFTENMQRKRWMPAAYPIKESLDLLRWYKDRTGQPVEIHYTLISGENDSLQDAWELERLLAGAWAPIKFLHFAHKEGDTHRSPDPAWQAFLKEYLENSGIAVELYSPPGADIEAACGQFTVSDYVETSIGTLVDITPAGRIRVELHSEVLA